MSEVPKKLLACLMISGAQTYERAVSDSALARLLGMAKGDVDKEIDSLGKRGYLVAVVRNGENHIYLSNIGIIAASSAFS